MTKKENLEHLFFLKYETVRRYVEEVFTEKEVVDIEKTIFSIPCTTPYERTIFRKMLAREERTLYDLLDGVDWADDKKIHTICIIDISIRILRNSYKESLKRV